MESGEWRAESGESRLETQHSTLNAQHSTLSTQHWPTCKAQSETKVTTTQVKSCQVNSPVIQLFIYPLIVKTHKLQGKASKERKRDTCNLLCDYITYNSCTGYTCSSSHSLSARKFRYNSLAVSMIHLVIRNAFPSLLPPSSSPSSPSSSSCSFSCILSFLFSLPSFTHVCFIRNLSFSHPRTASLHLFKLSLELSLRVVCICICLTLSPFFFFVFSSFFLLYLLESLLFLELCSHNTHTDTFSLHSCVAALFDGSVDS